MPLEVSEEMRRSAELGFVRALSTLIEPHSYKTGLDGEAGEASCEGGEPLFAGKKFGLSDAAQVGQRADFYAINGYCSGTCGCRPFVFDEESNTWKPDLYETSLSEHTLGVTG